MASLRSLFSSEIALIKQHTARLPAYIEVASYINDIHLYNKCAEVLEELVQLQNKLEDARVFIGNRFMQQTRAFFLYARSAAASRIVANKKVYKELCPYYAVGINTPIRLLKKK
ncbi:MAG: hypothetical protein NTZ47_04805 [Bacteroidetes bacterium]|nr:hypothetical protein [Bacteroidota bacterium]